jgi:hypothetical protein
LTLGWNPGCQTPPFDTWLKIYEIIEFRYPDTGNCLKKITAPPRKYQHISTVPGDLQVFVCGLAMGGEMANNENWSSECT